MSYHGKYKVVNPQKYSGVDVNNIKYKSLLERRFMKFLDLSGNVQNWCYEGIIVPYVCGTDNKLHRYFPDFLVLFTDGRRVLVEIKPQSECSAPKKRKRKTRRYLTECFTYCKNMSKWAAAEHFCKKRGWEFKIVTDAQLK